MQAETRWHLQRRKREARAGPRAKRTRISRSSQSIVVDSKKFESGTSVGTNSSRRKQEEQQHAINNASRRKQEGQRLDIEHQKHQSDTSGAQNSLNGFSKNVTAQRQRVGSHSDETCHRRAAAKVVSRGAKKRREQKAR